MSKNVFAGVAGLLLVGCGGAVSTDDVASTAENITGGLLAVSNDPPLSATVKIDWDGCSGTKVARRRFVTAAHCIQGHVAGDSIQITTALDGGFSTSYTTTRVVAHPSYELVPIQGYSFDVAVVDISVDTPAISELPISDIFAGDGAIFLMAGYGCDAADPTHSGKKQGAFVQSLSLSDYKLNAPGDALDSEGRYRHTVILSGANGVEGCPGDSGGTLLGTNSAGDYALQGVTAYHLPGFPYTFETRAGDVRLWVADPHKNVFSAGSGGFFISGGSAKCLGLGSAASNGSLIQLICDGRSQSTDSEYWSLVDRGSGYFSLRNGLTGLCAGVDHASTSSGARVAQYACDGTTNQSWKFTLFQSGFYRIVNRKSGLCMATNGVTATNGAPLYQFTCGNGNEQRWIFSQ